MEKMNKKEKGMKFQNEVQKQLEINGWKILMRNRIIKIGRSSKSSEIDLLASKDDKICIFECKNWSNVEIYKSSIYSCGKKRLEHLRYQLMRQFKAVSNLGELLLNKKICWCLIFNDFEIKNIKGKLFYGKNIFRRERWGSFPADVFIVAFDNFNFFINKTITEVKESGFNEKINKKIQREKIMTNRLKGRLKLLKNKREARIEARKILENLKTKNKGILELKKVLDLMHPYIYRLDDIDFEIEKIEFVLKEKKKVGKEKEKRVIKTTAQITPTQNN